MAIVIVKGTGSETKMREFLASKGESQEEIDTFVQELKDMGLHFQAADDEDKKQWTPPDPNKPMKYSWLAGGWVNIDE